MGGPKKRGPGSSGGPKPGGPKTRISSVSSTQSPLPATATSTSVAPVSQSGIGGGNAGGGGPPPQQQMPYGMNSQLPTSSAIAPEPTPVMQSNIHSMLPTPAPPPPVHHPKVSLSIQQVQVVNVMSDLAEECRITLTCAEIVVSTTGCAADSTCLRISKSNT